MVAGKGSPSLGNGSVAPEGAGCEPDLAPHEHKGKDCQMPQITVTEHLLLHQKESPMTVRPDPRGTPLSVEGAGSLFSVVPVWSIW